MKTTHQIWFQDASDMDRIPSKSVQLVVTSPPYPMISMWDDLFKGLNPKSYKHLVQNQKAEAFEAMHQVLDRVWDEVYRILEPGCIACINIGDATRKVGDDFQLYPNHSRILQHMMDIGFQTLPAIIWRKQTNAPNKFMGSGMLPAGAYVTLEHEYILILRKGGKRIFKSVEEKANRQASALFWEERNQWFSDIWFDLKGTVQKITDKEVRKRSGAYPFALPHRLINMYSVKGDLVLDPFMGLGTTTLAAMASARNSVGFELEKNLKTIMEKRILQAAPELNHVVTTRLKNHQAFVKTRKKDKKPLKNFNIPHNFEVITRQEANLSLDWIEKIIQEKTNPDSLAFSISHTKTQYQNQTGTFEDLWKMTT